MVRDLNNIGLNECNGSILRYTKQDSMGIDALVANPTSTLRDGT
ncbi:hypothetical protein YSA_10924 [Pseudomonas putida ND6]|uniref:Uncharacterized protein n=1 Tax=Pseudomonas putida ND6 TaxID=231023 RepID=I3V4M5_PSEPU|nr:hypothetical protein YSA_10924 [Pseudomonas putida ND6]